MPSLRQLLALHSPILMLDAASSEVQVGLLRRDAAPRWEFSREEAGTGVFRCIEALGNSVNEAEAFAFCDGPGSILGIRTVAMALRAWMVVSPRPTYAYSSLALVAHGLDRRDVNVIADARRETWHHFRVGETLTRVNASMLSGPLLMPDNFRHWSDLPPNTTIVPYQLADLWPRVADHDILLPAEHPDAFLHEEPSYATWTPQIHRAPISS